MEVRESYGKRQFILPTNDQTGEYSGIQRSAGWFLSFDFIFEKSYFCLHGAFSLNLLEIKFEITREEFTTMLASVRL